MSTVTQLSDYQAHPSGIYLPATTSESTQNTCEQPEHTAPAPAVGTGQDLPDGRTARVRALETEVAEREELAALYAQRDETPVDSAATRKLRADSADAEARRRELANPARIALRDMRAQLWVNLVGFLACLIALGWSTANVQATAALGEPTGTPAWWLAWGVEPLISAALLTVMGAKAYLATRQVTVSDRWVSAAQWVPLGYTVALNCWTSLPVPALAHPGVEFLRGLLVHSVGPVVVVLLVHALPVLWAAFIGLHTTPAGSVRNSSEQQQRDEPDLDYDRARALLDVVRPAHRAGDITSGVTAIRRYLAAQGHRAGVPICQWIRDQLKHGGDPA